MTLGGLEKITPCLDSPREGGFVVHLFAGWPRARASSHPVSWKVNPTTCQQLSEHPRDSLSFAGTTRPTSLLLDRTQSIPRKTAEMVFLDSGTGD